MQVIDQIISITSFGLLKKLRRELDILLGRRNCVIKYMGKKMLVFKFQSNLLCSMKVFYILKEFSPGFDVSLSVTLDVES